MAVTNNAAYYNAATIMKKVLYYMLRIQQSYKTVQRCYLYVATSSAPNTIILV
jgi:hypothetical protein